MRGVYPTPGSRFQIYIEGDGTVKAKEDGKVPRELILGEFRHSIHRSLERASFAIQERRKALDPFPVSHPSFGWGGEGREGAASVHHSRENATGLGNQP